jgi:hypothetical protein
MSETSWTHPFVDLALGMRLFSRPSLVDGVEEFGVEMESYLVGFLHDTAVGSVAGHCRWDERGLWGLVTQGLGSHWQSGCGVGVQGVLLLKTTRNENRIG